MGISIALATYNGAKYLEEQLTSIASQTLAPSELVVGDDGSTDNTLELVRHFAHGAPFGVRVLQGRSQGAGRGSTGNFERVIAACQGEAIALCDQDDVWETNKLEVLAAALQEPGVGLAFSDASLINEQGQPLPGRLWEYSGVDSRTRHALASAPFEFLLSHTVVTGATMAFRSSLRPWLLPIPLGPLIHDGWIALVASALCQVRPVDEPLIRYRQHASQQTGVSDMKAHRVGSPEHYVAQREQWSALHERLLTPEARAQWRPGSEREIAVLAPQLQHLSARIGLPSSRISRALAVGHEALSGRYHRFSNGWKSIARDLLS